MELLRYGAARIAQGSSRELSRTMEKWEDEAFVRESKALDGLILQLYVEHNTVAYVDLIGMEEEKILIIIDSTS